MSLLDKQEVKYICDHTALRAKKRSGFIYERQKIRHFRARSAEEEECQFAIFFTSRGAYVICAIIALIRLEIRLNPPEHDGGV